MAAVRAAVPILLLLGVHLVIGSGLAEAKPKKPSPAAQHLAEGRRLYNAGDFAGALREFEAANAAQNADPAVWFDLGVTLRVLGRDAEAMDALQKFLWHAESASAEQKQLAQRMLAEMDAKRDSELGASRPPPVAPAGPPRPVRLRTFIAGGATVVLGGATVAMGLGTRSRYHELRDGCAKTASCTDSSVDGLDQRILLTNVLLGLTVAAAATTGALLYLDLRGEKKEVGVAWNF